MGSDFSLAPSLYIKKVGESTSKLELKLTTAVDKVLVRFTGGCGGMSEEDAQGLYGIFTEAFDGFAGGIIFGGTRMLKRGDAEKIVPGITEIPPMIRRKCSRSVILGVVPKSQDLRLSEHGLVVSNEDGNDFFTIIHPEQDQCLVVQQSVDQGVDWEAEFKECIRITEDLKNFAGFQSLLVSYNGGGVTEKEILATAELGWPILLINGSGRKTEEYANNPWFLKKYPNVVVVEKNAASIRKELISLGVIKRVFSVVEFKKTA